MRNDRDENFEGHEEGEYHFSDEEVNYELEPETSKPVSGGGEGKANMMNRLTRSRRMLISIGVFFALVFVVYKMVAPAPTTIPSTDINPAVAQQKPVRDMMANAPRPEQAQTAAPANFPQPTTAQAPVIPVTSPTTPATMEPPKPVVAVAPSAMQPTNTMPTMPQPPVVTAQPAPTMPNQAAAMPTSVPPPGQYATAPPVMAQQSVPPVQPTLPPGQMAQTAGPNVAPVEDNNLSSVAVQNEKMIGQLQADYSQKLNDYVTQNKALQDQMQTLTTRVAMMESQLNQLVQTLTRRAGMAPNVSAPPVAAVPPSSMEPRASYNVQAIIPGRAWLRSDSGETVTVAEGDVVKDLGRVSKIDPYDGIVEINTGSKVISLSYGNGG